MANRQMVMSAGERNRTDVGVAMAMAAVTGTSENPGLHQELHPDLLPKEAAHPLIEAAHHLIEAVRHPIEPARRLPRIETRKDKC
jgi:hypothetical protein